MPTLSLFKRGIMEVLRTSIDGPLVIRPDVWHDARGRFLELYRRPRYAEFGINDEFVQDNCSYSQHGVIRGLHYQTGDRPQGKLITTLHGCILDVAVDIRFGSPTFGRHVAVELTSDNYVQFWVPPGFAHGFSVLSNEAVVSYKCTSVYSEKCERSVVFNDPDLKIDWQVTNPIVSEKDLRALPFRSVGKEFIYHRD